MSLLARILLLVLLATLTPAAVIGYFLFERRDGDIEEARHNLVALAKYAGENLDDKVRGTVQLLYGLSRARDLDDKAACSVFLAGVLQHYPQYTGLLTITPDGDLLCDSLRSGRELNLSARDYFRQVRATQAPAFDVVFGGLTGIAVLQVAYPVLDAQGTLKYVLLASLNLSEYAQSFVASNPYPNLRMLIWDRKGSLLVRSPDSGGAVLVGRNFAASELFRFAADGRSARHGWRPPGLGARCPAGVPQRRRGHHAGYPARRAGGRGQQRPAQGAGDPDCRFAPGIPGRLVRRGNRYPPPGAAHCRRGATRRRGGPGCAHRRALPEG
jgi:hypothetical protein